jgi:hypothetical protein
MRNKTTPRPDRGRRPDPIRKRCRRCRSWVLPGVLVLGDCPTCTGVQALPLVDSTGRALRPNNYPQVLPGHVTDDESTGGTR